MKRLAVFVEGQTEQIFVTKLVTEIFGNKRISIEHQQRVYGQRFETIKACNADEGTEYYILIRDCMGDSAVKTSIIEVAEKFHSIGYEKILGLQDVYPISIDDLPKRQKWRTFGVPTKYLPINIVLAVMEVEAWFLAETTHFKRIHSDLTPDIVKSTLHFDPSSESVELRPNPAKDLNDVYKRVGYAYNKRMKNCSRTVEALDYSLLYLSLRSRIQSLNEFITEIDSFLA